MPLIEFAPFLDPIDTLSASDIVTVTDPSGLPKRTTVGAIAALVPSGSVTLSDMANLAVDKVIGRATAGTGVPEAITFTAAARALADDADAAAQRVTLGLTAVFTGAQAATNVAEVRPGFFFGVPAAPDLVSVSADAVVANGVLILATQPGGPCKLQFRITDADSSISAGIATIVGFDASNIPRTEAIALTGGTATKTTTWNYGLVTSIMVTALAGADGINDKLGVGLSGAIGLLAPAGATTFVVYKSTVDFVNEAVGTVDATAGTITPTTAPNGTHNFSFWYSFSITPTQNTHTHQSVAP